MKEKCYIRYKECFFYNGYVVGNGEIITEFSEQLAQYISEDDYNYSVAILNDAIKSTKFNKKCNRLCEYMLLCTFCTSLCFA